MFEIGDRVVVVPGAPAGKHWYRGTVCALPRSGSERIQIGDLAGHCAVRLDGSDVLVPFWNFELRALDVVECLAELERLDGARL